MSIVNLDEISNENIVGIQHKVNNYFNVLDNIVNEIINPYCLDLDEYVKFINTCLADGNNPPTDAELEDFCLNLSTRLYFISGACEQLGIKDDISRVIKNETYNQKRSEVKGTVADKDAYAELESQQEQLTNICYNRAYKIIKAKVDNAQELLASCKKVLSKRITDAELTKIQR